MNILLTGKTGQVGYELERSLQGLGNIIALDRKQMDLSDCNQVRKVIFDIKPDLIINPAAYTAVDKAESERNLVMRINAEAPAVMSEVAKKIGAAIVYYSTDYVFDGAKKTPYVESDVPCPINVYGESKLAGEQAIQASGVAHLIFRTSWVYGMRGSNFLLSILRLAQEREELRIVDDQHGSPTWCRTIAETTAYIVSQIVLYEKNNQTAYEWWENRSGLYHLTSQGQTTWYGFASAILKNSCLIERPILKAIETQDYPLPARRPSNSVLCCEKLINTFCGLINWKNALKLCQS